MTVPQGEVSNGIQYVPSKLSLHTFTKEFPELKVQYQVIKMKECVFVIINDAAEKDFNNLSIATQSRFETSPIGVCLMGDFMDDLSKIMAVRVSKKLKKTAFLSCSISDKMVLPLVEKHLYEEIKKNPDKF